MPHQLRLIVAVLVAVFRDRADVIAENIALRHQLACLKHRGKRPKLRALDRALWVALSRFWPCWKELLVMVKPATVVAWHRKGFGTVWTASARSKSGLHFGRPGRTGTQRGGLEVCGRIVWTTLLPSTSDSFFESFARMSTTSIMTGLISVSTRTPRHAARSRRGVAMWSRFHGSAGSIIGMLGTNEMPRSSSFGVLARHRIFAEDGPKRFGGVFGHDGITRCRVVAPTVERRHEEGRPRGTASFRCVVRR